MKTLFSIVAALALACALTACSTDSKTSAGKTSPGAMNDQKDGCCGGSGGCSDAAKPGTSMGAVGEKKAGGCCSDAAKSGASMGAVGEKKEGGCCSGSAAKTTGT